MESQLEERTIFPLAAVFAKRSLAHIAQEQLLENGYEKIWVGFVSNLQRHSEQDFDLSISLGQTRVHSENWLRRFFTEGDELLEDALLVHNVKPSDLDSTVEPDSFEAVLTVEVGDRLNEAVAEIMKLGGRVLTRNGAAAGSNSTSEVSRLRVIAEEIPQPSLGQISLRAE